MNNTTINKTMEFISDNKAECYTALFGILTFIAIMINVFGFMAYANRYGTAKKITENHFKQIIESKGHYVGFFGTCPYKKNDRYYLPCASILNEQQLKEFRSSETLK